LGTLDEPGAPLKGEPDLQFQTAVVGVFCKYSASGACRLIGSPE
jgi:hypothetical protein